MSEIIRKYDVEMLALANLTLRPRFIQEEEPAFEILPELDEEIKPLEIEVPHKKDVVMRLIKRIKKD
jgi:hypothetical protein